MNANKEVLRLNTVYALIQSFFWMLYAAILGFASVYLLDAGFTNTQIGLMTAAAFTVSSLLQPVIASYADRAESLSVKTLLILLTGVAMAVALALLLTRGNLPLTGLCFAAAMVMLSLLTPLVNALATETINQGKPLQFGIARGMGSLGYAVAAFILGWLEARVGTVLVPVSMLIIFGIMLAALSCYPFSKTRTASQREQKQERGILHFLGAYRSFAVTILGCTLVYTGHAFLNSYTFQIVESKGGGSGELGIIMALSACVELPAMFGFGILRRKASPALWLKVAGLFMTLKSLFTMLVPNMALFYPVQILQMAGFALIAVDSVYYANGQVEPRDAVKGQALMTMALTVGNVLGGLFGGPLIDGFGITAMLAVSTALSTAGALLIFWKAGPNRV